MSLDSNILFYGKKEKLAKKVALKAGKLDLVYENGFLRYIKLGGLEVLRMINHAVRDHNWGTVPLRVFNVNIKKEDNSFSINYQAEARQDDIRFLWNCNIEGKDDNSITFIIVGEALTNFKRNRIGFTVLHPIKECEGKEAVIKNSDGITKVQKFPKLISPNQPFSDINSMKWELANCKALLEFSGEIFETEDQRNWTDESYKTYCTPLELPFPVELKKGDKVWQIINLSIIGEPDEKETESMDLMFSIGKKSFSLPKINIGLSTEVESLSESETKKIKAIPFDHYQVDIKFYETGWEENVKRATRESESLGFPMEFSLFFNDIENELKAFGSLIQKVNPLISFINIFNKNLYTTQKKTIDMVLPYLRDLFPNARIGAGTNAFFAELNRDRTKMDLLDFSVYSINPQVHAFDNESMVETIFAQPYTVQSAREFSQSKPVHISPVTLKMRWNPNATSESTTPPEQLPEDVDVRQMSLFGASWVLGSINSLLKSEPESIAFFETIGLKGIMQSSDPMFADQFFAPAKVVYPMYFIFKFILEHKDLSFYHIEPSHVLHFTGLAFGKKGISVSSLILANYSSDSISVKLPTEFNNSSAIFIHDKNIIKLMEDPDEFNDLKKESLKEKIELPPFGIAFIGREVLPET